MTRYVVGLLLISSMLMQAPQPDLRAIEARKALQAKLAERAKAKLAQGATVDAREDAADTLRRIEESREENRQASAEFTKKMVAVAGKGKASKKQGSVPQALLKVVTDQGQAMALSDALGNKPLSNGKTVEQLARAISQ